MRYHIPMTNEKTAPSPKQWLSLKEASGFLGVHFTTLRTWADNGEIRVMRTPGGHRRFSVADLRRFLEERASHTLVTNPDGLVDAAVGRVRQEIAKQPGGGEQWRYALDEAANVERQQRGRKLFSLAISYVLKPKQHAYLLEEGRLLGREYGEEAARNQVSLMETGRAVQFFRHQLIQAIHALDGPEPLDADDVRIQQAINYFLDEVLYAVLEGFEQTLLLSAHHSSREKSEDSV